MKMPKLLFIVIALLSICYDVIAQTGTISPTMVPGKNIWPVKEIPAIIPEYKGKVANYGNGGETNWFLIYVVENNAKKVQDYIDQYKKNGWTLSKDGTSDKAIKDQYEVVIHFYKEQSLVGITISIRSTDKQWPWKEYSFIPRFDKCLSSTIRDYEYNLTIDVKKAKESDINAYKRDLVKKGWEGDPEGEEFHWKMNGLDITLQITNQGDGTWFFDISK